jgi:hypothetical protein
MADHGHDNQPELIVDDVPYQWQKPTISGAEIRRLAALPEGTQLFMKVPGRPDREIADDTVIDLTARPGPEHFRSQSVGSQAG